MIILFSCNFITINCINKKTLRKNGLLKCLMLLILKRIVKKTIKIFIDKKMQIITYYFYL